MYTKEGIDCYVQAELSKLRESVSNLRNTTIAVIHDSMRDPANNAYLRNKIKLAQSIGLTIQNCCANSIIMLEDTVNDLIADHIPYLIQLPHRGNDNDPEYFKSLFRAGYDIDGLSDANLGALFRSRGPERNLIIPCTARGIYEHFTRFYKPEPGSVALLIGRSMLVNKPLEIILRDWFDMDVVMVHSKSKIRLRSTPSLIVSAVGKKVSLKNYGIQSSELHDTIVYDVGIRSVGGKLRGDLSWDSILQATAKVTPVPGGVGRLTTLSFLKNSVDLLELLQ